MRNFKIFFFSFQPVPWKLLMAKFYKRKGEFEFFEKLN